MSGDSSIRQNQPAGTSARLSFADFMPEAKSAVQLAAQPVFDGNSVLNGGDTRTAAPTPAAPAAPPGSTDNSIRGGPPGNRVFFQARPSWKDPNPPAPGFFGGGPHETPGQPTTRGPIDPGLRPTLPAPDAPGNDHIPAPTPGYTPPTREAGPEVPDYAEYGVIGIGAVLAYKNKERYFKVPTLDNALATQESREKLKPIFEKVNLASVDYEEALEKHYRSVSRLIPPEGGVRKPGQLTAERAGQFEAHAVLSSASPDLEDDRRSLRTQSTDVERAQWKKTFEEVVNREVAKGHTDFDKDAIAYFEERRRIANWTKRMTNPVTKDPEIHFLKDTPPLPNDNILAKLTGPNEKAGTAYKTAATELKTGMLDRLGVQGEEFVSKYRTGNGWGWMAGAAVGDYMFDKHYYTDVRAGLGTYIGDAVQMGISMFPAVGKVQWAWKIGLMALAHISGRTADAKAQGKV